MCLLNVTTKKPLIANEDITVYKFIQNRVLLVDNWRDLVFHGCIAVIKNETVEGKISINQSNDLYICQNSYNGDAADDKLGYKYSWIIDPSVTSIIINGKEIITMLDYQTIYQNSLVKIGNEYTSELIFECSQVNIGLHSYIKPDIDMRYILVECLIPKGSKYYIGNFNEKESIASDRLRYVKIIY